MVGIEISSVRINGKDVPIDSLDDLRDVHGLISATLKWACSPENGKANPVERSSARSPLMNKPPVGERAIDYAIRGAERLPAKFTMIALYEEMQRLGWKTTSKTREIGVSQVRQLAKHNPRFRSLGEGLWTYSAAGPSAQPSFGV